MQPTIAEARSRFSGIIAAAERGEKVIIAKTEVPVVRLAPIFAPRPIRPGLLEGVVRISPEVEETEVG